MDVQRPDGGEDADECIHSRQAPENAKSTKGKEKMIMGPLEKRKVKVKVKVLPENPKTVKSKTKKVKVHPEKKKVSLRGKRARVGIEDIYDDVEAKFTVLERAGKHLESLKGEETPFFAKYMLPSNVSYSFWLIIPRKFSASYLPEADSSVILVDDWGIEYETTYLMNRNGLSAGWRGFALAHKLQKGDILFFRLIAPCKLQVHIVRVNSSDVIRAADSLMLMESFGREADSDTAKKGHGKRKKARKYTECQLLNVPKTPNNTSENFSSEFPEEGEASFLHDHPREAVTCRRAEINVESGGGNVLL